MESLYDTINPYRTGKIKHDESQKKPHFSMNAERWGFIILSKRRQLHMPKLHDLNRYHRMVSFLIIFSVTCFFLGAGCSIQKPYVGKKMNTANWTKYVSGKKINHLYRTCHI